MKAYGIALWTSACLIMIGDVGEARAQEIDRKEAGSQLDEIIVTAQKRAENLQTVPISATVVSGDQVEDRHIYDPSQLQLVAPSLQIKSFNAALGASNFSIRGVGTLSFANSIESSVTSVIDGVVMGSPALGFMNFLDLAQIEVLNGPQGMLFGKNASAGLVNITTRRPEFDKYGGRVNMELASMNAPGRGLQYRVQAIANVPLSPTAAIRLSASQTHNDPLITNVIDVPGTKFGQDQSSVRAKFLWEPTSNLSMFFAADYAHSTGIGSGSAADRIVLPNSAFRAENARYGIVAGPNNSYSSYGAPTNAVFDVGGVQSNIDYKFASGHTLTNIIAWRKFKANNLFDSDKHAINILDTNSQLANIRQLTEELRFASPVGGIVDYQLGLYYYDSHSDTVLTLRGALGRPTPPPPGFVAWTGIKSVGSMTSKSYAAFGQGTLHLGERVRLTAGGRYTYDKLSLLSVNDTSGVVIPVGAPGTRNQAVDEKNFSWRLGAQFDVADHVMAYASVARGYKGPGFNLSTDVRAPLILSEIPTSYEAGIKSALFDRKLILNASAYTSVFKNFQAQAFDPGSNGYVLVNAGELKSRGFEVEASARPIKELTFNLGLSYVDAFFSDYRGDRCYPFQPNCNPNGTTNSTGNQLPNSSKLTVSFTGRYETEISSSYGAFVQGALYRRSKSNFSSNADPSTILPSYTLLDASVGLKELNNSLTLSLFCRNCFNKRFPTFINSNSQSRGDYYHLFGLNSYRTIGVSLDGRF